jgi:transcriptional regulator with XRE-family HTH domain
MGKMVKNETLGIFLKRLRLDNNDEKLKDMANRLNVSIAYISAVENGKRQMNDQMYEALITQYHLNPEQIEELDHLKEMAVNRINIEFGEIDEEKKQIVVKFLSEIDKMDKNELDKINLILKKKKERK